MWSLFFLIVTGRAPEDDDLDGGRSTSKSSSSCTSFEDGSVRDQDHRGHALSAVRRAADEGRASSSARSEAAKGVALRTAGVSDGKGFVFVSHTGEIFPSGFLPVYGRQRHRGFAHRRVPEFRLVQDAARHRRSAGASAGCASTRRSAADRGRGRSRYGRLSGRGPALRLSATPRRSGRGLSGLFSPDV